MLQRTARTLCSLEAVKKGAPTLEQRIILVQHEASDVAYRIIRAARTPQDAEAIMADIAVDLGDLIVQAQMLAVDLGLDPDAVLKLGLNHTYERFQDFWG